MKYLITLNDISYEVIVEQGVAHATKVESPILKSEIKAPAPKPITKKTEEVKEDTRISEGHAVKAPMPGTIISVAAVKGNTVKSGDVLLVLEAMKMENDIVAPKDGTITGVYVSKGQTVETGATLLTIS